MTTLRHRTLSVLALCGTLGAWSGTGLANCGQAVCALNTDWEAQGVGHEQGTRLDLRFEYVDQDSARAGSSKVDKNSGDGDHSEQRTINRNWVATLDHSFNAQWGVSVALPYSSRRHDHVHHDNGTDEPEQWSYTELGDVRVLGRFQAAPAEATGASWGATAGLKLPTGKRDLRNDEGELAERMLQPGTGTTDLILGALLHRSMDTADAFVQIQFQRALSERDHFKPGMRTTLDMGVRYPLSDAFALLGQINFVHRGRDKGDEAEPDESGGRYVFISPGASYSVSRNLRLYGFVQIPIYQYVNGMQLTADWAASAGLSVRF